MHVVKAIFIILGNALALWLANKFIPGFVLNANWYQLIVIALILSLLNFIIKPLFVLILGPIIVLTLGLGIIVVNAIIIYGLSILANRIDFLHGSITIQGIPALLLTTLLISAVNFVIHLAI